MKRNLLLLAACFAICTSARSQFGLIGDIVKGASNSATKKKEKNNKRLGDAPALVPSTNTSLPMVIPPGDPDYVSSTGVSTFNKQHAGEIVFSKSVIPKEISSSEKLAKAFDMSEQIQMRFFMATSLWNYYLYTPGSNEPKKNPKAFYTTLLYIDNDTLHPIFIGDKYLDKEIKNANTFKDAVIAVGEYKIYNNPYLIEKFNGLSYGSHNIRVELWAGDIVDATSPRSLRPICSGKFTLLKKDGQKIHKGKTMADVAVGMSDPELEASALKGINNYATAQRWKETFTELKIIGKEWYVVRNELTGAILSRRIDVYAKGVWPDGHCTGVIFGVAQQYDGTAYSKICYYNGIGPTDKLECD